jgi:hypothetical protein
MAYVGRSTDKISNVEVLDNITFDGSSSYTLQKNSVNFTPSSANTLLVSIDGVVQAGNFTVSGSTIDFGTAVAGTSTCDFILHYGTGLITTPADGSVTTAKLGDASVTSAKLGSDVTQGITEADQWRLTADLTGTNAVISSNLERVDTAGQGTLGTGMTESSGVFTFPSTGIWFVMFDGIAVNTTATDNVDVRLEATINNSTYTMVAIAYDSVGGTASNAGASLHCNSIIDVTDTTNVKVRFKTNSFAAASLLNGTSTENRSCFTFIRLGNT